jgi:hypothetical protein
MWVKAQGCRRRLVGASRQIVSDDADIGGLFDLGRSAAEALLDEELYRRDVTILSCRDDGTPDCAPVGGREGLVHLRAQLFDGDVGLAAGAAFDTGHENLPEY